MKVKFALGIVVPPRMTTDTAHELMELVTMADSFGVHAITTGDTGFFLSDVTIAVTLMALASKRAYVGMRPTNPVTREPQVMAGFFAQLDAMTGGRALCDMGSGDSAVYNIGRKAAARAQIEEYVTCMRDLVTKGEGAYAGRTHRVNARPRKPPRISILAEGPKMLHLGGRIGDAVTTGAGLTPEVVQDTIERVQAGAREVGRLPEEVDIWFAARTGLSERREEAIDDAMGIVSSILNHAMRFSLDGKNVPEDLRDRVQEYVDGYVLGDHAARMGRNRQRMDELGLTEYACRRWMLAGDPGDWIDRVHEIADAGVAQIWVHALHSIEKQKEFVRLLGEKVMPTFQ